MIGTTETQLFIKTGLTDDDDWSDPSTTAPSAGRQHDVAWRVNFTQPDREDMS